MLKSETNYTFELGRLCTHHVNHACSSMDVPNNKPAAGQLVYSHKCL